VCVCVCVCARACVLTKKNAAHQTVSTDPVAVVVLLNKRSLAVMSRYRCSVSTGAYPSAVANRCAVAVFPSPRCPITHRSLPEACDVVIRPTTSPTGSRTRAEEPAEVPPSRRGVARFGITPLRTAAVSSSRTAKRAGNMRDMRSPTDTVGSSRASVAHPTTAFSDG